MQKLRQVWQFLNTDIRELGKPGEFVEATADVSKAVLELAIAIGLLAGSPVAPIAAAGLAFVGITRRGVKLYREKTNKELSLEEWVAIAFPLAYLESFHELVQSNDILQQIGTTSISQPVQQQSDKLGEFQLDEHLARNALTCFHESELAQALNQLLSTQLQQAGIPQKEAQIFTAWVAWGTHKYVTPALDMAEDSVRQIAEMYGVGRPNEADKYDSIDGYLQEQIATKPQETVFVEKFTFRDIYVPLKAMPVDENGDFKKNEEPIDLENWAKRILQDAEKQNQVIFIQGGPGRGKSVFCRMFSDWVRQHLHPIWTPILIRLREIRTFEKNFEKTLQAAVKADFATNDTGWLTDRNTRFLFLLDGFDELLMEGRTSGGLEQFLKQVGQFQRDCQQSSEMGHRVLITGRKLALQSLERLLPSNLERVEILPMDDQLQQQWFSKWQVQVGTDQASNFQQFLQDQRCPDRVRELAKEPLLIYLLAAMYRDGELTVEMFEGATATKAKILIYQQSLDWVLTKQRPEILNRELTEQDTEDLRRILTEAGLCVVQSGGESAAVAMIEERLKGDNGAKTLLEEAQRRIGDNPLRNALAAFYLQQGSKEGAVEFAHKSFGEFLCAQRLKESIEEWTKPGKRGRGFNVSDEVLYWEIYDLLGYGGLTPEIVEYLMGLLMNPPSPPYQGGDMSSPQLPYQGGDMSSAQLPYQGGDMSSPNSSFTNGGEEFRPVVLFKRLEDFYLLWCDGEFIDTSEDTLPQRKTRQLQKQGIQLGQRQVDVCAGLNVMILLFELHRYAQSRNDLKDEINFQACGNPSTEGFDSWQLYRIIGYSHCFKINAFVQIVGSFLSGADLSDAYLSRANLSKADLRGADLRSAFLSRADLRGADLSGADLRGAFLSRADLSGTDLSGTDLIGADLRGADLSRADLSDADLRGAKLSGAKLSGADLSGADLSGADLSRADLIGADLSRADLSRANLKNLSWDKDTNWENVRGLETAVNVPKALKQQLGLD